MRRAGKYVLIGAIVLAVAVVGAGVSAYLLVNGSLSSIRSIKDPFTSIPAAQRALGPTGLASKDMTFLVSGIGTPSPAGNQDKTSAGGRTDMLMLVHLIAGGKGAYVVSIPRDSWVPIPGHGHGKVTSAYSFGGPSLAVHTVEDLTHVRVDHVAVINWAGLSTLTNVIGGVGIWVPVRSYDPASHVTWTQGFHRLDGAQALLYIGDRALSNGDFGRVERQQNLLRAVFWRLHHVASPTRPLYMLSLLHALSHAVNVDDTLGDVAMTRLVLSLRRLGGGGVLFTTVPYDGTGRVGSGRQSVVNLDLSLDRGFWHAFEYDNLPTFMKAHGLQPLGPTTP